MTCDYCEPVEQFGDSMVTPLETPEGHERSAMMAIADHCGEWFLVTAEYPCDIARPINYCPMCGRKLEGDA